MIRGLAEGKGTIFFENRVPGEGEVGVAGGFKITGFEHGGADAVGFEISGLVVGDLVDSNASNFGGWSAVNGAGLGRNPVGGGGDHAGEGAGAR